MVVSHGHSHGHSKFAGGLDLDHSYPTISSKLKDDLNNLDQNSHNCQFFDSAKFILCSRGRGLGTAAVDAHALTDLKFAGPYLHDFDNIWTIYTFTAKMIISEFYNLRKTATRCVENCYVRIYKDHSFSS